MLQNIVTNSRVGQLLEIHPLYVYKQNLPYNKVITIITSNLVSTDLQQKRTRSILGRPGHRVHGCNATSQARPGQASPNREIGQVWCDVTWRHRTTGDSSLRPAARPGRNRSGGDICSASMIAPARVTVAVPIGTHRNVSISRLLRVSCGRWRVCPGGLSVQSGVEIISNLAAL